MGLSRKSWVTAVAVGSAIALCASLFVGGPASALTDDHRPGSVGAAAESLAGVSDSLRLPAVAGSKIGEVSLGKGTVEVPRDLTDGVKFTGPDNETLVVNLPGADRAARGSSLADGTVTYPSQEFTNSVIVGQHKVQMLTTIPSPASPTRFNYRLKLEHGQSLQIVNGAPTVVAADGGVVSSAGAAWAVDAEGRAVPTHYEVEGSTLVQVVDHTASRSVAYPVVADPIWIAPWVVRCLASLGLNGPQISRIANLGSPAAILAAFGFGALRCVLGR